jgi:hypothetical protein
MKYFPEIANVVAETPTDVDETISDFRFIYAKFKSSSTKSFYVRL